MSLRRIATLDIGKTHARLLVLDAASGELLWQRGRDSVPLDTALGRQLDVHGIEAWLLDALAGCPHREAIDAIVPVAHGAAAVLIDAAGQVIAAPDYEDPQFEACAADYRAARDPFAATCSPLLPLGLNLARQWLVLQIRHAAEFARARHALLYPQYWAWRLSDVMSSEVTSLGCHTDLWLPAGGNFSTLARNRGWDALLPPLRAAGDPLGPISAAVRRRTGLPPDCRVLCGIHDSNASYLCHLASRPAGERFALISSGTWTVIFARGVPLNLLREADDMLANVDARGAPVATARFMGGREYAQIAGSSDAAGEGTWNDVQTLLSAGVLALPSFAAGGPFREHPGRITGAIASAGGRAALGSLYLALMTQLLLARLEAGDPVIVDGPLARSALYAPLLASLRRDQQVLLAAPTSGAATAARILCGVAATVPARPALHAPVDAAQLAHYMAQWQQRLPPCG